MTKEEIIELAKQAGFERLGHTAEDWVCHFEDIEEFTKLVAEKAIKEALVQPKEPEQEPVGKFAKFTDNIWREVTNGSAGVPLYTTPPQRKPLSDEEMKKIWYAMQNIMGWYSFQEIARAIEATQELRS